MFDEFPRNDHPDAIQLTMKSGSCVFWESGLWHGGGANSTSAQDGTYRERMGFFISHCAVSFVFLFMRSPTLASQQPFVDRATCGLRRSSWFPFHVRSCVRCRSCFRCGARHTKTRSCG